LGQHQSSEGTWRNHAVLGEVLAEDLLTVSLDPLKAAFWLAFGVPRAEQFEPSPHSPSR
jgi:hypothetical protein